MALRVLAVVACGLVAIVGGLIALAVLSESKPIESQTPDRGQFVLATAPPPPPPPPAPAAAASKPTVDDRPQRATFNVPFGRQADGGAVQDAAARPNSEDLDSGARELLPSRANKAGKRAVEPSSRQSISTEDQAVADAQVDELPVEQLPPWPEVEARFAALRKNRAKPADSFALMQYYSTIASPHSTGSNSYSEHCARLAEWRRDAPKSTAAMVCQAMAHIKWAWQARGGGWAHTVTDEGWELFHTRIAEARRLLEEAVDQGVGDGQAHASLLTVAMAQGLEDEQARRWFDAGHKLDPHYVRLYEQMAVGLMPRWGGQPGDVERFAAEATKMLPGDDGLEMFGWIARQIHQYEYGDPVTLFWGEYDRELLMKAAEVLAQRYPQSQPIVQFAALCSMATQDHEAAKRIRPLVGSYRREDQVWIWGRIFDEFIQWCEAPEIPTGETQWIWGTHFPDRGVAFASDPRFVWCGQAYGSPVLRLLDIETGDVELSLPGPASQLASWTIDHEKGWVLANLRQEAFTGWVLWDLEVPLPIPHPTEWSCEAVAIHPKLPQVAWMEGSEPDERRQRHYALRFFDVENNKEGPRIVLPGYTDRIIFSPDGSTIVTGGASPAAWDTSTGTKKFELPGFSREPKPEPRCETILGFDHEGWLWAIGEQREAKPAPGTIPLPKRPLMRFGPDGKSSQVVIENLVTNVDITAKEAVLSPDFRRLAVPVGRQGNFSQPILIWEVQSGRIVKRLGGHWRPHGDMAFSADGRKLATLGMFGGPIKIWSLEDLHEDGK